jgi:hypothetical protein
MRRALSFGTPQSRAKPQASDDDEDHAPSEWLAVLLQRVEAGDPRLSRLRLAAHLELSTLTREQQRDTIARLQRSRVLTELDVSSLQLNDAAARALACLLAPTGAPSLVKLSAERNNFADAGALAICDALRANARLAELSLADQLRPISQKTAAAFCEMLERNHALRRLNLGHFVDPANTLRQRLSKLVMRNADRAREERNAACAAQLAGGQTLVATPAAAHHDRVDWSLEAARLADSLPPLAARLGRVDGEGRAQLLLGKDVSFACASDEARRALLSALGTNSTVERADLGGVRLSDAELVVVARALARNRTLKTLSLEGNAIAMGAEASAALCAALRANRTLTELRLAEQRTPWSRAAEEAIADAVDDNRALLKVTLNSTRSTKARDLVERSTTRNQQALRRAQAEQAVGTRLQGASLGAAGTDDDDREAAPPRAQPAASAQRAMKWAVALRRPSSEQGRSLDAAVCAPREPTPVAAGMEGARPRALGRPEAAQPAPPPAPQRGLEPAPQTADACRVRRTSPSRRRFAHVASAGAQNVPAPLRFGPPLAGAGEKRRGAAGIVVVNKLQSARSVMAQANLTN